MDLHSNEHGKLSDWSTECLIISVRYHIPLQDYLSFLLQSQFYSLKSSPQPKRQNYFWRRKTHLRRLPCFHSVINVAFPSHILNKVHSFVNVRTKQDFALTKQMNQLKKFHRAIKILKKKHLQKFTITVSPSVQIYCTTSQIQKGDIE